MRVKALRFLPKSVNFSDLAPNQEQQFYDETEQEQRDKAIDKEILLLKTLNSLNSDKERCVFLLEILREYGYQIDFGSIAPALHIQKRWLYRVKANVRKKVQQVTSNE